MTRTTHDGRPHQDRPHEQPHPLASTDDEADLEVAWRWLNRLLSQGEWASSQPEGPAAAEQARGR
jgi:hypothetical protein